MHDFHSSPSRGRALESFQPCTYTLATGTSVNGYALGKTGLGYREVTFPRDTPRQDRTYPYDDRYIVDHLPTGYSVIGPIGWLYTPTQVQAFLLRCAPLWDWNQSSVTDLSPAERKALTRALLSIRKDILSRHPRFKAETIGRAAILIQQELSQEERDPAYRWQLCDAYREEILEYLFNH